MTPPIEPQAVPAGDAAKWPRRSVDYTLTDRMRAAIERLEALAALIVEKLDELGIDADLEPVLGAPEPVPFREGFDQTHWGEEGDVDERESGDGDQEPSLGSLQTRTAPSGETSTAATVSPAPLTATIVSRTRRARADTRAFG